MDWNLLFGVFGAVSSLITIFGGIFALPRIIKNSLFKVLEPKFSAIENRFNIIDEKFKAIDIRLQHMDERINTLSDQTKEIRQDLRLVNSTLITKILSDAQMEKKQ